MKFIGDCFKYSHCVRLSDFLSGHLRMFQIYRMTEQSSVMCRTETIGCHHWPSQKWDKFGVDDQGKFFKKFKYNFFLYIL